MLGIAGHSPALACTKCRTNQISVHRHDTHCFYVLGFAFSFFGSVNKIYRYNMFGLWKLTLRCPEKLTVETLLFVVLNLG
jgi:hypothetical protein